MAFTFKNTQSGAAAFVDNVTPTVLLTAPAAPTKGDLLVKLLITNIDTTTAVTLELYHVASGGSISGDDWKIVKALSVKASDGLYGTDDVREIAGIYLEPGDTLQALAGTASKLKFNLTYQEET